MFKLCTPSIIYLIFSITQILIDIYKGLYNTAFMKVIVAAMVTLLLNILCESGLSGVSWLIVFIPFILMTLLVSMLLYVFGLDAASGNLDYTCKDKDGTTTTSSSEEVIVRCSLRKLSEAPRKCESSSRRTRSESSGWTRPSHSSILPTISSPDRPKISHQRAE